jgi:hypothetical protein
MEWRRFFRIHQVEKKRMSASTLELSEILKGVPEGAWVAISEQPRRVIAYSPDIQTVLESAKRNGEDEPLIVRVPEQSGMLFL